MEGTLDQPVTFKFVGGNLALDFANTAAWSGDRREREPLRQFYSLSTYPALLKWSLQAGTISSNEHDLLRETARQRPDVADEVLERALRLRGAIHWTVVAAWEGYPADPADLAVVEREVHRSQKQSRLVQMEQGFRWVWTGDEILELPLPPVAKAAGELLASSNLDRVRPCAGDPCGFLFLDTSPTGKRRWCVMEECGNRAKARRHYQRSRGQAV